MLETGRRPTPEEIDAIMSRARRLRAQYVGALMTRAWRRALRSLIGTGGRRALAALQAEGR
jgi:hypothetical protein